MHGFTPAVPRLWPVLLRHGRQVQLQGHTRRVMAVCTSQQLAGLCPQCGCKVGAGVGYVRAGKEACQVLQRQARCCRICCRCRARHA